MVGLHPPLSHPRGAKASCSCSAGRSPCSTPLTSKARMTRMQTTAGCCRTAARHPPSQSRGPTAATHLLSVDLLLRTAEDACIAQFSALIRLPDVPGHPLPPQLLGSFVTQAKTKRSGAPGSHNAVECARRETLNARFLVRFFFLFLLHLFVYSLPLQDLAALLSNLKHLIRPSKSAIVNSSIAHARAACRYRHLASQQLRKLNAEYGPPRGQPVACTHWRPPCRHACVERGLPAHARRGGACIQPH
jgi:hypothetical protein